MVRKEALQSFSAMRPDVSSSSSNTISPVSPSPLFPEIQLSSNFERGTFSVHGNKSKDKERAALVKLIEIIQRYVYAF